jgi:hypothetical protein
LEDREKRKNKNLPRLACLLVAVYSREIYKPTLAYEKRRERRLPLADYIDTKKKRATPPLERRPAVEHTKQKEKTKQLRTTSQLAKPASQRS